MNKVFVKVLIVVAIIIAIVAIIGVIGFFSLKNWYENSLNAVNKSSNAEKIKVEIVIGMGTEDIANLL